MRIDRIALKRRVGSLTLLVVALSGPALAASAPVSTARLTDQETDTSSYGSAACFVDDALGPTVTAAVVSKTTPYIPGYTRQGGSYYIYANVSPGAGPVTRVSSDVRNLTPGQSMTPLTAGSFSVGGVAYGWRSAALTVQNPLTQASHAFSVSAADANSRCKTRSSAVVVDNTAPAPTNVQPLNKVGGMVGRMEIGDTITYTFSETIDPQTILAGWTGASTNVVVRLTNGGSNDAVSVWNAANSAQLAFGSVALGQNHAGANRTFGATGTPSTMVQSGATITVTLGTASGAVNTQPANSLAVWTTSAGPTDRAGNACLTPIVNEGGAADPNF